MAIIKESLALIERDLNQLYKLIVPALAKVLGQAARGANFETPEGFKQFLASVSVPLISKNSKSLLRVQWGKLICNGQDVSNVFSKDFKKFVQIMSSKNLLIEFGYTDSRAHHGQAKTAHAFDMLLANPAIVFLLSDYELRTIQYSLKNGGDLYSAFDSIMTHPRNHETFLHEVQHIFQYVSKHLMYATDFEEGLVNHLKRRGFSEDYVNYMLNPFEIEAHFVHTMRKLTHDFVFPPDRPAVRPNNWKAQPTELEPYLRHASRPFRLAANALEYQPANPTPEYIKYYGNVLGLYKRMIRDFQESVTRYKHEDF